MKYILKNIKSFARDYTKIFLLLIVTIGLYLHGEVFRVSAGAKVGRAARLSLQFGYERSSGRRC
ncbi:MAG: hypothetical protein HFH62_00130 [Lachnospiraceae bacterium]|nr:hypothetical protein [Lachnospiraceae bacterium]